MDFHSSLRKSFKHSRRISAGAVEDIHLEHQPILSNPYRSDDDHSIRSPFDLGENREVIVKIDSGDNNRDVQRGNGRSSGIWRGSSYEFWTEDHRRGGGGGGDSSDGFDFHRKEVEVAPDDPPSQMIRHFLNRQRDAGGDMPLDMDMEMEELRSTHSPRNVPPRFNAQSPRNITPRGNAPSPRNMIPQSSVQSPQSGVPSPQSSIQSPRNIPAIAESSLNQNRNRNNNEADNRGSHSREVKVSFQDHTEPEQTGKKYMDSSDDDDRSTKQYKSRRRSSNISPTADNTGASEVLRCSSFQRRASNVNLKKTQSRLMDPSVHPELISGKGGKSGPMRSGITGRASGYIGRMSGMLSRADDDEDDFLIDEDIPDDFRKNKLDAITLLQWISLVIITTSLISTLVIPKWKRRTFHGLGIWEWEVLILALICGRLVSGWGIRIFVFFIERNFLLRKRVLYFVYGLRKAVQNCIWLGLVLLTWQCLFDNKVDGNNKVLAFVNRLMFCMLVASLLWLVKTLVVKVLASSFHVSTFFDRIQDSLFNQYVIETLSGPPVVEIQSIQEEEEITRAEISTLEKAGAVLPADLRTSALEATTLGKNSGKMMGSGKLNKPPSFTSKQSDSNAKKHDDGISIDHLHKLNTKNVSAWNMKRLMKIVRHGFRSTLDEQILNSTTEEDDSSTEIRSELEAKVAARKIFLNVARPQSKFIYMEDLMRFLRLEEAIKTMTLLEGSPDGERISKAALKNWVVNAFRERRALALTLNDTKTAVKKLHTMVNVLVSILILIICLVILGIATSKFVLFLGSQVVVVAFVFGNTCKQIFEAVIFLFAMHPFDVGDRCEIDGIQMIVEEMNILTTVFLRYDNLKIIYPNSTLATKAISNYYRSPDMGDSVDFFIHIATPKEKLEIMKQRIISYIEDTTDHWYSAPSVVLMNLEDLNKMKMSVWLRHKMNHQDMGEKWTRRALLVDEMVKIFKDLGIEYRLYPIDINVCSMPAVSSTRLPPTWPSSSHVRKSESIPSLDMLKTL